MIHMIITINEYKIIIDYSVEKDLKSFKEEVLNELYSIYKNQNVNDLLFSGGMDSTFILRSFLELGIKPNLHTLCFAEDASDYDSINAKQQCKKYGIKEPNFFFLDIKDIVEHINFLTFEKQVALPSLHGYYVDYFLSKMQEIKFFSGMSCEFRLLPNGIITMGIGPPLLKLKTPNRLYGFDTSRTILSYVNDSIFKDNYLKKQPQCPIGENKWHIRNLIYNNCYSDISIIEKNLPGDKHISEFFHKNFVPIIIEKFPLMGLIKPFAFNVQEYFQNKSLREKNELS